MVWESVATMGRLLWRRLGLLVLANILWLALTLPIVTWPAATGGLFTLVRRVVAEELDNAAVETTISDFWDGFRSHWRRASMLTAIDLAGMGTIAVALYFYARSPAEPQRWLAGPIVLVGLVWLTAQIYVFPLLLERPARAPWEVLREALLMTLGYPLQSLSLLVTSLVIAVPAIVLAGPVLLVLFSAMALMQTVAVRLLLIERGQLERAAP